MLKEQACSAVEYYEKGTFCMMFFQAEFIAE